MFRYNPKTNYQPNRGRYLQILSGQDLYKQTIVVSARAHDDTFLVRFPNIFVDYPLGQMRIGDKLWTNWNKAPMRLWQTQLNLAVFCASSACGVSLAHPSIQWLGRFIDFTFIITLGKFWKDYRFLCHTRPVLMRLITLILSQFFKICEDYRVPNDPMKYQDEKFYWSYQHGIHWPDDYIGPDSMTRWIVEKSVGFTDVGLWKISESVRAYAYLILSSQASARSGIVGNTTTVWVNIWLFASKWHDLKNQAGNCWVQ